MYTQFITPQNQNFPPNMRSLNLTLHWFCKVKWLMPLLMVEAKQEVKAAKQGVEVAKKLVAKAEKAVGSSIQGRCDHLIGLFKALKLLFGGDSPERKAAIQEWREEVKQEWREVRAAKQAVRAAEARHCDAIGADSPEAKQEVEKAVEALEKAVEKTMQANEAVVAAAQVRTVSAVMEARQAADQAVRAAFSANAEVRRLAAGQEVGAEAVEEVMWKVEAAAIGWELMAEMWVIDLGGQHLGDEGIKKAI